EVAIDVEHHFAGTFRVRIAATLVGGENLVVAEFGRAFAGDLADGAEHAALEIDQGADDVKGENLEIAERQITGGHGRFFSVAGTVWLVNVHSDAFGTMMVSSGWRVTVMGPPGCGIRR